jgi:hypothetical protein
MTLRAIIDIPHCGKIASYSITPSASANAAKDRSTALSPFRTRPK